MAIRSCGIILHTFFTKQNKIAILDEHLGRIDGIIYKPIGSAGVLLSYRYEQRGRRIYLHDVHIVDSPLGLAAEDILFLHHVLELCSVCMPIGSCTVGVFELLQTLYRPATPKYTRQYKKIFMYQLLTLLGVETASYRMSSQTCALLQDFSATHPATDTVLDDMSESQLDTWLHYSIGEYVDTTQLKTINFLYVSRVL